MSKLPLTLLAALAALTLGAAEATPTLQTHDAAWANRLQLSANGFGRFGAKGTIDGVGGEHGELWGMGLDMRLNLLPKEHFNLWLGLGVDWAPEQDFANCAYTERGGFIGYEYAYVMTDKLRLSSYGARVMLIPEWKVSSSFALGLRLGLGIDHLRGELSEHWVYSDDFGTDHGTDCYKSSDNLLVGIVGVQATWGITEHFGLFGYVDGRFSGDLDLTDGGTTLGSVDNTAIEAGLGLHWTF